MLTRYLYRRSGEIVKEQVQVLETFDFRKSAHESRNSVESHPDTMVNPILSQLDQDTMQAALGRRILIAKIPSASVHPQTTNQGLNSHVRLKTVRSGKEKAVGSQAKHDTVEVKGDDGSTVEGSGEDEETSVENFDDNEDQEEMSL